MASELSNLIVNERARVIAETLNGGLLVFQQGGTDLVTFQLRNPAFNFTSTNEYSLNLPDPVFAQASGTVETVVFKDAQGIDVMWGAISAFFNINKINISRDLPVAITGLPMAEGICFIDQEATGVEIAESLKNLRANAFLDKLSFGFFEIYEGPRPASINDDPPTGQQLARVMLSETPFSEPQNGVANLTAPLVLPVTLSGPGVLGVFRDNSGNALAYLDIGETGEGQDIELDSINLIMGVPVTIDVNYEVLDGPCSLPGYCAMIGATNRITIGPLGGTQFNITNSLGASTPGVMMRTARNFVSPYWVNTITNFETLDAVPGETETFVSTDADPIYVKISPTQYAHLPAGTSQNPIYVSDAFTETQILPAVSGEGSLTLGYDAITNYLYVARDLNTVQLYQYDVSNNFALLNKYDLLSVFPGNGFTVAPFMVEDGVIYVQNSNGDLLIARVGEWVLLGTIPAATMGSSSRGNTYAKLDAWFYSDGVSLPIVPNVSMQVEQIAVENATVCPTTPVDED